MKNLFILLIGVFLLFSCEEQTVKPSADKQQMDQTELAMQEANRQVGMPAIANFQEKKNLKWIYELCDQEDFICYAYLFNEFEGKIGQYLGQCIGYGIPYSTQFSNPERIVNGGKMLGYTVSSYETVQGLPQPEPNGLFKPEGLSATWLIMIDPETGDPRPVYVEPTIIVSPFPLHNLKQ